jgi:hypothetical protein
VIGQVLAVLLGAAFPLVALAVFVQWRLAAFAQRSAGLSQRRRERRRPRQTARRSLAWLRASLGPPPADLPARRGAVGQGVTCPNCRYVNETPSVFCRRCGTRVAGR